MYANNKVSLEIFFFLPLRAKYIKGNIKLCLPCEKIKQLWCIKLKNKVTKEKMMHYFNNTLHSYCIFHHNDQ